MIIGIISDLCNHTKPCTVHIIPSVVDENDHCELHHCYSRAACGYNRRVNLHSKQGNSQRMKHLCVYT